MSTRITINGTATDVPDGISVAAAIARAGQPFRRSLQDFPRAPLCGMGVCFECRANIDGRAEQRSCMVTVREGMQVTTHA